MSFQVTQTWQHARVHTVAAASSPERIHILYQYIVEVCIYMTCKPWQAGAGPGLQADHMFKS